MFKYNKNLIFKNFFYDVLKIFFLLLISLSLIVWVVQAVNYLDFVTEDGHGINVYLKYSFLNYPKILTKLIPIIFFCEFRLRTVKSLSRLFLRLRYSSTILLLVGLSKKFRESDNFLSSLKNKQKKQVLIFRLVI